MRKSFLVLGIVSAVALAVVAAPLAEATCAPAKRFSQWDASSATYAYTNFQQPQTNAAIIGALWQTGARSAANEGSGCEDTSWLNPYAGQWYINGFLNGLDPQGDLCQPTGCPSGDMTIVVEAPRSGGGAEFGVTRVGETSFGFNYSTAGTLNTADIPRPNVSSSGRSGTNVNINFTLPGRDSAYAGAAPVNQAISSYRIVRFRGNADPGRGSGQWSLLQSFPYNSAGVSGSLTIDCADTTQDEFIATQVSYDNGQYLGALVSQSVRIECDPNLANPDRDFKLIDRPTTGPRPIRDR